MSKFVILFLCLTVLQASLALKCHKCSNTDCTKTEEETCVASGSQKPACLKATYADATKSNEIITEKKCVLLNASSKYECPDLPNKTKKTCEVCETDNCNSKAPGSIGLSMFSLVAVALALVVPKFM